MKLLAEHCGPVAGEFVSIRATARYSLPLEALFAAAAALILQPATRACVRDVADARLVRCAMTATRWTSRAGKSDTPASVPGVQRSRRDRRLIAAAAMRDPSVGG